MRDAYSVNEFRKYFKISSKGNLLRKTGEKVIGSLHSKGYRVFGFKNKTFYVHRVLFAVKFGYFPEHIDHINRVRDDNVLRNLRASDPQSNQENRNLSKKNNSGISGVYFSNGKWRVQVRYRWKRYNLGSFKNKNEAIKRRKLWQRKKPKRK